MSEDGGDDGPEELVDKELEAVQGGAGVRFGDYSVLSPGVQIVLKGRPISCPEG